MTSRTAATASSPTEAPTRAAFAIVGVVSRRWIDTLVSTEETSTQVRVIFDRALAAEGLAELITPDDEHTGRGEQIRQARIEGLRQAREQRLDYHRRNHNNTPKEPA